MITIAPTAAMASLVRSFTIVETEAETSRVLLPETGAVLGVRYGGSAALVESGQTTVLTDVTLTGMRNTVRRMRTSAGGGIIVASFHEAGARMIFGLAMHHLFNNIIGLHDLIASEEIDELRSAVASVNDSSERVRAVERFLLTRRSHPKPDTAVAAAVRAMRFAHGTVSIRTLALGLGLSQDRFEKRFRQELGASPKQYCSILRFRRALGAYPAHSNLAELAVEAGYYDQSHFIREFHAVTGETPQRFLYGTEYC